jgi:hypothetical protein
MIPVDYCAANFSWNIVVALNQEQRWMHQGGPGEKHGKSANDPLVLALDGCGSVILDNGF